MAAPWRTKLITVVAFSLEAVWSWCLLHLLIGVAGNQYDEFGENQHGFGQEKYLIPDNMLTLTIRSFEFGPKDIYFELITSTEAEIEKSSQKYAQDSWFPGFAWSIANCPRCGSHIGWVFDAVGYMADGVKASVESFVGLVFDKIMHEDEVNNLIAMPKVYAS